MFNDKYLTGLEMFNLLHIITLLVMILIVFLTVMFSRKIKVNSKTDKIIRYSMATFLLVFELTYYIWTLADGNDFADINPFAAFCGMTNILTIIYLYSNSTKLANYVFYYALTGSFFSLLFVDITHAFPHFRYFHYFGIHFGFSLIAIYNYVIRRVKIERRSFNFASLYLISYTLVILVLDFILDENWFYFKESPVKEISDFFGSFYPPLWIIVIYLLMNIWYFLFKGIDKLRYRNVDSINIER